VMQMALMLFSGIALVIVPLLALTADQVEKIKRAVQTYGTVEAFHIDDLTEKYIRETLITRMYQLAASTSSSIFLFCSPQCLVEKTYFRQAVLESR